MLQNVQLLIATTDQKQGDYSLLEKLNVQSDAIVCNQCGRSSCEEFIWNGHTIVWLCFDEKGVGRNRNNALMRATGDIVVFCDDDMTFVDGYPEKLIEGFRSIPNADVLIFNIVGRDQNKKVSRVNRFNYLGYGAARIAVDRQKIKNAGILFNLHFGGGTEHQHGEDAIFLTDCLNKGLKIYTYPVLIAELKEERASTWRNGYDEKYFADQGALYKQISRKYWKCLCLANAIKHRKRYKISWVKAYKLMTSKN